MADMAQRIPVTLIPGDGIGKETVPEGIRQATVSESAAKMVGP